MFALEIINALNEKPELARKGANMKLRRPRKTCGCSSTCQCEPGCAFCSFESEFSHTDNEMDVNG